MTLIGTIVIVTWAALFIGVVYFTARLIMRAWLTEIDLYINKLLKRYLSKIEREHEESKE